MQFNDKVPIYYQIKNVVYYQIITGQLAPGEQLPAVRQVAVNLTVNVNTAQRALSEMVTEGVLESRRGRGNFVTQDRAKITALRHRVIDETVNRLVKQLRALTLSDPEILRAVNGSITKEES